MMETNGFPGASDVQLYATAQVRFALTGCQRGDASDCSWLAAFGVDYLGLVAPHHNAEALATTLIRQSLGNRPAQIQLALELRNRVAPV